MPFFELINSTKTPIDIDASSLRIVRNKEFKHRLSITRSRRFEVVENDLGMDHTTGYREVRFAHQKEVDFTRSLAAFGNGPDDQGLAAAAISGRKQPRDRGREAVLRGLDVAPGVALDLQLAEDRVLRPQEAHGEQHELAGVDLLAVLDLGHDPTAVHPLPLDHDGADAGDAAGLIHKELLALRVEATRVVAELDHDLLVTVVDL